MTKQVYVFNPTTVLSGIYKASQCKDENDFLIALNDIDAKIKLITSLGRSVHRSIYNRKNSLLKGYKRLLDKNYCTNRIKSIRNSYAS